MLSPCLAHNAAALTLDIVTDGNIFTQYGSYANATTSYYDLVNSFDGSNDFPTLTADFASDKVLTLDLRGPAGVSFNVEPHAGHNTLFLVEFWTGEEQTGSTLDGLVSSISFDNASGEIPTIFDNTTKNLWYSDGNLSVSCTAVANGNFSFSGFSVTLTAPEGFDTSFSAESLSGFIGVYEENYASDPGDIGLLTTVPEPAEASALLGMAALGALTLHRRRRA